MKNTYLTTLKKETCYGCGACEMVCSVNAIKMQEDECGFRYPVLDNASCIDCGKCQKCCPKDNVGERAQKDGSIFLVEHKKEEVLANSQSGGFFTAISDVVLESGGIVYGAAINELLAVEHIRADNCRKRDRMRTSKYVQSVIGRDLLERIGHDLENGRTVLFSGTPCQCRAVHNLYRDRENLIIADFICHGTPSPKLWRDYLGYVEDKYKMKPTKAKFRNCFFEGFGNHSESILLDNEKRLISINYTTLFYSHIAHRSSCYECGFAKEERKSDITFGGALDWGKRGICYELGLSQVFINTDKGQKLFERIADKVTFQEKERKMLNNQPCLYGPIDRPTNAEKFWEDYIQLSFEQLLIKYAKDDIKKKYCISTEEKHGELSFEDRLCEL